MKRIAVLCLVLGSCLLSGAGPNSVPSPVLFNLDPMLRHPYRYDLEYEREIDLRVTALYPGFPYLAYVQDGGLYILFDTGTRMAERPIGIFITDRIESAPEKLEYYSKVIDGQVARIDGTEWRIHWAAHYAETREGKRDRKLDIEIPPALDLDMKFVPLSRSLIRIDVKNLSIPVQRQLREGSASIAIAQHPSGRLHVLTAME